jgi:hypothetical protein
MLRGYNYANARDLRLMFSVLTEEQKAAFCETREKERIASLDRVSKKFVWAFCAWVAAVAAFCFTHLSSNAPSVDQHTRFDNGFVVWCLVLTSFFLVLVVAKYTVVYFDKWEK